MQKKWGKTNEKKKKSKDHERKLKREWRENERNMKRLGRNNEGNSCGNCWRTVVSVLMPFDVGWYLVRTSFSCRAEVVRNLDEHPCGIQRFRSFSRLCAGWYHHKAVKKTETNCVLIIFIWYVCTCGESSRRVGNCARKIWFLCMWTCLIGSKFVGFAIFFVDNIVLQRNSAAFWGKLCNYIRFIWIS